MTYVDERRMEITCGEAPYLVSRYNAATGKIIPLKQRIGLLERKIRVVKENSDNETDWLKWSKHAFLNLFMVFNIKKIACFWQEKTFLQHRAGVVQKNYVKLFILILIFTTTTELK